MSHSPSHENIHLDTQEEQEFSQDSLREKLELIINNLPEDALTLAEIRDLLGRDGMLLLVVLLTVVFLIPVSIPGVSTIFGATILLIGVSLTFGWNLWLPKVFLKKELPAKKLREGFEMGLKWFTRLEKISKSHRLQILTNNRLANALNGLSIILGAVLLMFPFGFIPFSNTLPAIALLFYAIGLLQKDGVSILCGYIFNILTILYFVILISGGGVVLYELIRYFAEQV